MIVINNFKDILEYIPINKKVIFFIDIDNTLLHNNIILFSDEFIHYHDGLIKDNKSKLFKNHKELYDHYVNYLIKDDYNVEVVENETKTIVQKISNHKIVLLTARNKELFKLTKKHIHKLYDINLYNLCNFTHNKYKFKDGIFMTSGNNKSYGIDYVLKKSPILFDTIIFIDDNINNINEVEEYYKLSDYKVLCFHYINGIKYKNEFEQIDKDVVHSLWLDYITPQSVS